MRTVRKILLRHRRNDILEEPGVEPGEVKWEQYKQKYVIHVSKMEDKGYPKTALWLSTNRKTKTWMAIKETIGRIKSRDRNRRFIGLTLLWKEKEVNNNTDANL
jgi:hypothetical protein